MLTQRITCFQVAFAEGQVNKSNRPETQLWPHTAQEPNTTGPLLTREGRERWLRVLIY